VFNSWSCYFIVFDFVKLIYLLRKMFSAAKDALVGLKDTALNMIQTKPSLYKYSDPNQSEIKGMSKIDFEATKIILESKLKLNSRKEENKSSSLSSSLDASAPSFVPSSTFNNDINTGVSNLSTSNEKQPLSSSSFDQVGQVQTKYQSVDKEEWSKPPSVLYNPSLIQDDKQDEIILSKKDENEVITLPTLHLKEQPQIIEREIEYEKPVQVKQTIIHQEKPIIIEQPIIKEKYEHYRDNTQFIKNNSKIVQETTLNNDNGKLEQEALLNLRKERIDTYNNTTPIVQHTKEHVQLPTVVNEQPTIINEKQVLYQQPIEIEQKFIEKVKPIVNENVRLEKEHVHEKLAPEVLTNNAATINEGHEFYSKDAATRDNNNDESFVAGQDSRS